MISAKVELNQPLRTGRQFVSQTGSGHHLLLDDAAGGTGPKPIELVAAGLAGCTAFDVITVLRQKYHQKVTGYEVRVEADQADRPPQVFTACCRVSFEDSAAGWAMATCKNHAAAMAAVMNFKRVLNSESRQARPASSTRSFPRRSHMWCENLPSFAPSLRRNNTSLPRGESLPPARPRRFQSR